MSEKFAILNGELENHEKDLEFQQSQMEHASQREQAYRKQLLRYQADLVKFEKDCKKKSNSGVWITGSEHEQLYMIRASIERNIEDTKSALEIATETYQTERENRIANMRRIAEIKMAMLSLEKDMARLLSTMRKNVLVQCIDDIRHSRWRNVEPSLNRLYL
ncbi:hypothetical protein K450DRAFT_277591 [Umbelopsis ramanniana AG]|uniref:Uncharacterized protein n=1 Tax=Umbelopsis ramanniana AG TaxID=1314678 RepID=A0AAD5EG50_UMBRA|nr:uncharacterized protein K450DRAFT_277591 [Umbelopsis ramanniana AG]KAI8583103.1 hypothetical protein K450DRAFT_277591 [Umbelopsis ramanniana AG]